MNKRIIYAFLIGLIGFPLCVGIGFSTLAYANVEILQILTMALFAGIVVWPLYFFIGCPLWYWLYRVKQKRLKRSYLIATGVITAIPSIFLMGIFLAPIIILLALGVAYLMWRVSVKETEENT
jgi:ABC-type proline/glycine betaine transport system permease subunit